MEQIPWYRSNTLRGLLVAATVLIAQKLGIADKVGDADAAKLVDLVMSFAEMGAMAYAAWWRVHHPSPPVTTASAAKVAARVLKEGETQ